MKTYELLTVAAGAAVLAGPAYGADQSYEQKMNAYCNTQATTIAPNQDLTASLNGYNRTKGHISVQLPEQDPDCNDRIARVGARFRFIQPASDNDGVQRALSLSVRTEGSKAELISKDLAVYGCKKSDGKSRVVTVEGKFTAKEADGDIVSTTRTYGNMVQRCR